VPIFEFTHLKIQSQNYKKIRQF